MAIFIDGSGMGPSDKIIKDSIRYKEKVRRAVKEDIEHIIANQPILSQGGKKVIQVRLKSLIEYELKFDPEEGGLTGGSMDDQSGDASGVDVLEENTGITMDELIDVMLEDLEVPDLAKVLHGDKTFTVKYRAIGKKKTGSLARLHKKATVKQKIARERALKKKMRFERSDKRFKILQPIPDREEMAIVFLVLDTSGSMSEEKKYIARALYFCLVHYLRQVYKAVEIVFICHEATAREKNEEEFFKTAESGTTNISSGPAKALEIIKQRFSGQEYDIFYWHATDGENNPSDNPILVKVLEEICEISRLVGLCQIKANDNKPVADLPEIQDLMKIFEHFVVAKIEKKQEIRSVLLRFLNKRNFEEAE